MKTNLRLATIAVVTVVSLFLAAEAMADVSTHSLAIQPPGSISIPDKGTLTVSFTLPNPFIIEDVDVYIYITHRCIYDLSAELIAPDGTKVKLFDRVGSPGKNFGDPPAFAQDMGTQRDMCHFDDEAPRSISSALGLWAPFVPVILQTPSPPADDPASNLVNTWMGDWQPDGKLSDLDGLNAKGKWQLKIKDNESLLSGELNALTLRIDGKPLPVLNLRVNASSDDAEEHVLDDGKMESLTSSDLELGYEKEMEPKNLQTVGCRWWGIDIPKGATITDAWVQFDADDINNDWHIPDVSLIIEGELTPDPVTFSSTAGDITARPTTKEQVVWDIPRWMEKHLQGPEERTPDISSVIQEIVNQDGWAPGNAIVLMFRDNPDKPSQGTREAESYDGEPDRAPWLHIEYY